MDNKLNRALAAMTGACILIFFIVGMLFSVMYGSHGPEWTLAAFALPGVSVCSGVTLLVRWVLHKGFYKDLED